jgi:hypothetical protein
MTMWLWRSAASPPAAIGSAFRSAGKELPVSGFINVLLTIEPKSMPARDGQRDRGVAEEPPSWSQLQ